MASTDPRHGIWILPLVIVAMVGSTAVFVNSLTPGTVPAGTGTVTVTTDATGTTVTTVADQPTTTTTLAPEVQAYIDQVGVIEAEAQRLVQSATTINQEWDDRDISFGTALDRLRSLQTEAENFASDVDAATPTTLPAFEPAHLELTLVARAMSQAAEGMVVGLQDPNSSEGRRSSLQEFQDSGADLVAGVARVRAIAGGADPATAVPGTTLPGASDPGDTTDTTELGEDEALPDE